MTTGTEFRERRERLGIPLSIMASGLGLRITTLHAIETGSAISRSMKKLASWIEGLEKMPEGDRTRAIQRARHGETFY
jgi:DNA-binding XRE family transcriptional regulator